MYYTATEGQQYESTNAKSLKSAKAVASKRNPFLGGTWLQVAIIAHDEDGHEYFERVALKSNGEWRDTEYCLLDPVSEGYDFKFR